MKKYIAKYRRVFKGQIMLCGISILLLNMIFLLTEEYGFTDAIKYGLLALYVSIIIELPWVFIDVFEWLFSKSKKFLNGKKKASNKENSTDDSSESFGINFKNERVINSFAIIIFLTAFVTTCGAEAGKIFICLLKYIYTNNVDMSEIYVYAVLTMALLAPSIIPFMLYYSKACDFIYEKYMDYKNLKN